MGAQKGSRHEGRLETVVFLAFYESTVVTLPSSALIDESSSNIRWVVSPFLADEGDEGGSGLSPDVFEPFVDVGGGLRMEESWVWNSDVQLRPGVSLDEDAGCLLKLREQQESGAPDSVDLPSKVP